MSIIKATKKNLLLCNDDRDPISMSIIWTEDKGKKKVVYPKEQFDKLVLYKDTHGMIRCFEKESLQYLISYNILNHPVTSDVLPLYIFDNIDKINMEQIIEDKSIKEIALDVFQTLSKISIFIDYNWFLELNRNQLIRLNYELSDFWAQNFSAEQKLEISKENLLIKKEKDLVTSNIEDIQKYLLNQMKILLECTKEEYKYMINYIIIGALGLIIPQIKELYPDFELGF